MKPDNKEAIERFNKRFSSSTIEYWGAMHRQVEQFLEEELTRAREETVKAIILAIDKEAIKHISTGTTSYKGGIAWGLKTALEKCYDFLEEQGKQSKD